MYLENNKKYTFTGNTGTNQYQCVTYDMFKVYEVPVTGFSITYNVYFYGELLVGIPEDEWYSYQDKYYNYYISPSTTGINFIMANCPDNRGVFETEINNTAYMTTPLVYKDSLYYEPYYDSNYNSLSDIVEFDKGKALFRLGAINYWEEIQVGYGTITGTSYTQNSVYIDNSNQLQMWYTGNTYSQYPAYIYAYRMSNNNQTQASNTIYFNLRFRGIDSTSDYYGLQDVDVITSNDSVSSTGRRNITRKITVNNPIFETNIY